MPKGLNLRQYAEHRAAQGLHGQSHAAVLAAIKAGRIQKGAKRVGKRWSIDPAIADREWHEHSAPNMQRGEHGRGGRPRKSPAGPGPLFGENEEELSETRTEAATGTGGNTVTMRKAQEVQALYRARLTQLEYEQRSGRLVQASEVRVRQFSVARSVRDSILQVPDRIAAQVAALEDELQIRQVIEEELKIALKEVVEVLTHGTG